MEGLVRPVELQEVVHRKGQRKFVQSLARKIEDGVPLEEAKELAVRESFNQGATVSSPGRGGKRVWGKTAALRKANELLERKPWIQKGLELLFTAAGTPPEKVAKAHAELIDTPASIDEDTARASQVRQKAIDSYWNLTVPKQTQKLEIRSMSVLEVLNRPEPLAIDTSEDAK